MTLTNPNYLVDTTFSAKNISSPVSVHQWIVAASVKAQIIFGMTVAASGTYIVYITRQWIGAGSIYIIQPKSQVSLLAGETTPEFVSAPINFKVGDVVNVMVQGLAGDTNVSGVIRIVAENYSLIQPADVWLYNSIPEQYKPIDGSTITIRKNIQLTFSIQNLGSLAGRTKLWFTVKTENDLEDNDDESIIQIEETANLIYIDKQTFTAAGVLATDGTLVVNDATLGNITITLQANCTTLLTYFSKPLSYDICIKDATSKRQLTYGRAIIERAITKTT